MIPTLYAPTASVFTTNGLGALADAIDCTVEEERNGAYTLTMVYPVDGLHYGDLSLSSIIKAHCGDRRGAQLFRVYKVTRPLNGRVTVYAQHVSYQLSLIPCAPFTASSCNGALQGLASNAAESCPFTFWTDKATIANYKQTVPSSIRSQLGGVAGSVLDVYGGEYEFDNYTVKLWGNRGADNGVTLRYGKNIVDLTQEANIENTITGIYPYWTNESQTVTLPEKVISAPSASSYPYPRTVPLDCSDQFQDPPTVAQLRTFATNYVNQTGIGVPKVAVNVSFVNLRDTEEYADVAALETVELCDYVTVIYDRLGVDTKAQVVKTAWDVLAERYKSIDVGDLRSSLAETIAHTTEEAAEAVTGSALNAAIQRATDLISGVTGGYIKYKYNADGQPYEMLIMDSDSEATATNIWKYNANGWGFSHDGGASYTTAATIDGGIVADFITAGTLTGLEIDNGSGTFHVDSSGHVDASDMSITGGGDINLTSGSSDTSLITVTFPGQYVTDIAKIAPSGLLVMTDTTKRISLQYDGIYGWSNLDMRSGRVRLYDISNDVLRTQITSGEVHLYTSTGKDLARLGVGSDYGWLYLYDNNGTRRVRLGDTGLYFYDASGNLTKTYSAT